MRDTRPKIVVAAAALLFLLLLHQNDATAAHPRNNAVVGSPPVLNWRSVPRAVLYNVQLYRQSANGSQRILSRWPNESRLQLRSHWRYNGRARELTPARYFWYAWPWYGSRYGKRLVSSSFVYGRVPVNTSPPRLTGNPREGATLRVLPGTWTGLPKPTLGYQWSRCAADRSGCARIAGATRPTYVLRAEDIGHTIRATVLATNIARTVSASPSPSAVVRAAPPDNVSRPSIAGHPHVQATLRASPGAWRSSRPVTYSYTWLRCSADGLRCARIRGASGRVYAVRRADEFHRLAVAVRAVNSGGANEATSRASALVGLVLDGSGAWELLRGTRGSDVIRARGGNDTVYGLRGSDRLAGGRGSDSISGGAGSDLITSRDRFRDQVACGPGQDSVRADRRDRVASDCERVIRS